MYLLFVLSLLVGYAVQSQTLTFLLRNGQVVAGPKFQFEVWLKSSDGTSRMGSILVYNNYSTTAFGSSVVAGGRVTVAKNAAIFGTSYGQNASNDNTANRFAYSWTYIGAAGSGVVIPSAGDGALAFTVQINIAAISSHAALSLEGSLMNGEQYKDDEATVWPIIDATSILDEPLPIQLASFTAMVISSSRVRLEWRTLSETNNYGFEVQKSQDSITNFQPIPNSFLPGHGTTNEPHEYSFADSVAVVGRWYYRLKQIDLDGTVHYSDAIRVNLTTAVEEHQLPTAYGLLQNYPNPFNPTTTIRYDLPAPVHVTIKVYTVIGEEVATLVDKVQDAGFKFLTFATDRLASGMYFYRMTAGSFTEVKRMLVLK
jgi:hypothetical protein